MYAKIQPVSVGYPVKQADKLRVSNVVVNKLGDNGAAVLRWQMYNDQGSVTENSSELTGDAYVAWGADDSYLLTWLGTTLGLTITEIVSVDPEAAKPADPTK